MLENYSHPVDIYCERLDATFWSEPINALTNFAFILAAVFTYGLWREYSPKARDIKALIVLTALVGIGSFIFHTVATNGAMLFDVIPIVIFIHFAVVVIFKRVLGLRWLYAILGMLAFFVASIFLIKTVGREFLNGSFQYVPTLLLLASVSAYSAYKKHLVTKEFALACVAFTISITCRSMDMKLCNDIPFGIHFMWHTLNGVTMYYVIKGLIKEASGHKHLLKRKSA